jgi:hypothetical protein
MLISITGRTARRESDRFCCFASALSQSYMASTCRPVDRVRARAQRRGHADRDGARCRAERPGGAGREDRVRRDVRQEQDHACRAVILAQPAVVAAARPVYVTGRSSGRRHWCCAQTFAACRLRANLRRAPCKARRVQAPYHGRSAPVCHLRRTVSVRRRVRRGSH